jgi:FAD/FMN-containing dehydrogenase
MLDRSRRRLLLASSGAAAGALLPRLVTAQQRITMNDASRLSLTPVFKHRIVKPDTEAQLIAGLRRELKAAASLHRPVAVGAARHSMGGQSLPRNGTALTFDIARCELDRVSRTYRVHAGTRWYQAVQVLDAAGQSPAVMQSNSDFGIASTFSVNAHGWPVPYGPFGSTVRAFRIMLADGTLLDCSRTENAELFSLAMGGYGLLGILLDLEVDMVPNTLLRPRFERMDAGDFAARFVGAARSEPAVKMIYGRMNVARADFFTEALLVTYRPEPMPAEGLPPVTRRGALTGVSRKIYRAQVGSEPAKRARWVAETVAVPMAGSGVATRNSLMDEPVSNLENRHRGRTDILHEYFVPPERFNEFLRACQQIIPKARAEFLNVTLRYVVRDDLSVLSYAPGDRIAAVMSFSQAMTPEGEADMLRTTEALIDRVMAIGGSYYLPYRLHARNDQFERVYPRAGHFASRKRHYDPGLLFRNALWDTYLAA